MDDFRSRFNDLLVEQFDPRPELGESIIAQRVVHTAVHAVAGDDKIGFGFLKDPPEAFVEVGARERAAGVPRFGQPAYCLAWKPEIDEFGDFSIGIFDPHGRLEDRDVTARMGDAIP